MITTFAFWPYLTVIPVQPSTEPGRCATADPQITNMLHTYYGDRSIVEKHWASLVEYQENLISNATATALREYSEVP